MSVELTFVRRFFTSEEFKNYKDPFGVIFRYLANDYLLIEAFSGDTLVGRTVSGIYPTSSISRDNQWDFGNNRFRSFWIDRIDVRTEFQKKGVGKRLLEETERFLSKFSSSSNARKNLYLVCEHYLIPFYLKCGWELIYTNDHDEDEDYPDVFESECCSWLSKPFTGNKDLDSETKVLDILTPSELLNYMVAHYLPGIDRLEDSYYVEYLKNEDYHPYCILEFLIDHRTLKEVQGFYEKIERALKLETFDDFDSEFSFTISKRAKQNPEHSSIVEWLRTTSLANHLNFDAPY